MAFFASSCRIHAGTGAGASTVDSTGAADEYHAGAAAIGHHECAA